MQGYGLQLCSIRDLHFAFDCCEIRINIFDNNDELTARESNLNINYITWTQFFLYFTLNITASNQNYDYVLLCCPHIAYR